MTTNHNKVIDCNKCMYARECPIPRHVRKDGVDACEEFKERTTRTVVKGTEFPTLREAIAHAEASDLEAIHLDGKYFVLDPLEADRLDEAGVTFAFVYDLDGKIVTIPVN